MGISKLLKKFDIKVIGKVTKEQQIIIYCLLLSCIWRKSYLSKRGKFGGGI